jgi:hypothetical protein
MPISFTITVPTASDRDKFIQELLDPHVDPTSSRAKMAAREALAQARAAQHMDDILDAQFMGINNTAVTATAGPSLNPENRQRYYYSTENTLIYSPSALALVASPSPSPSPIIQTKKRHRMDGIQQTRRIKCNERLGVISCSASSNDGSAAVDYVYDDLTNTSYNEIASKPSQLHGVQGMDRSDDGEPFTDAGEPFMDAGETLKDAEEPLKDDEEPLKDDEEPLKDDEDGKSVDQTYDANIESEKSIPSISFAEGMSQLKEFKNKYGHVNLPKSYTENQSLVNWCQELRSNYRLKSLGIINDTGLTESQVLQLHDIGFHFTVNTTKFEERIDQLIEFSKKFGHVNVPSKYPANPSLARWCSSIRNDYKSKKKCGEMKNNLTDERIKELEALGFQWSLRVSFQERLQQLRQFKEKYGHVSVPIRFNENQSLADWCKALRKAYRLWKEGKPHRFDFTNTSFLTPLEELEFDWRFKTAQKQNTDANETSEENSTI